MEGLWRFLHADPDGLALLNQYRPLLESKRSDTVASTQVLLQGDRPVTHFGESNLGNAVTEAFLKFLAQMTPRANGSWSSVAAAIANGGGFRAPISDEVRADACELPPKPVCWYPC